LEEGRDVVRANVVEVAGDAERLGGLLPTDFRRVQPPADKYQRNNAQGGQHDRQPTSLGEFMPIDQGKSQSVEAAGDKSAVERGVPPNER